MFVTFKDFPQSHNINVHRDIYQTLDLATSFKGLTIVMLSDPPKDTQVSAQKSVWPFDYSSLYPSPTSTENKQSLEDVDELPIPSEVTEDKVFIQDEVWEPPNPKEVMQGNTHNDYLRYGKRILHEGYRIYNTSKAIHYA